MFALVDARTSSGTPSTAVDDLPWAASLPGMTVPDEARLAQGVIAWQGSLFGSDEPTFDPSLPGLQRHWLADGCYVDHLAGWLAGSDTLFAELVARLSWQQRRVPMYGRMVDEPRLTAWWSLAAEPTMPMPVLGAMAHALERHYDVRFDSLGCNLYRGGNDSVAWHTDRNGRGVPETVIAIVSVGAPRPFLVRPIGGGTSRSFLLGQGDLLVMGGETQRFFEHSVPKVAAAGPRLSIAYRYQADVVTPLFGRTNALRTDHHPASARDRHIPRADSEQGFVNVLGEGSAAPSRWPGRR